MIYLARILTIVALLLAFSAVAQNSSVFKITVDKAMVEVYNNVYESLELFFPLNVW